VRPKHTARRLQHDPVPQQLLLDQSYVQDHVQSYRQDVERDTRPRSYTPDYTVFKDRSKEVLPPPVLPSHVPVPRRKPRKRRNSRQRKVMAKLESLWI
jgi:hypothetical protein